MNQENLLLIWQQLNVLSTQRIREAVENDDGRKLVDWLPLADLCGDLLAQYLTSELSNPSPEVQMWAKRHLQTYRDMKRRHLLEEGVTLH